MERIAYSVDEAAQSAGIGLTKLRQENGKGGYRKPIEAAILKGLGVVAGVPDIIAIHQGRVFALELKAEGGRPTDKQLAALAAMEAAGAFTAITEGLDRARATLEGWGLLRGRVS